VIDRRSRHPKALGGERSWSIPWRTGRCVGISGLIILISVVTGTLLPIRFLGSASTDAQPLERLEAR
jgi:hypothetical protein